MTGPAGGGLLKVLLVSVNRLTSPYPVYPLGLDALAASLPGHDVSALDLGGAASEVPLAHALAERAPDVVGLSLRNVDNTDAAGARGFIDDLCRAVATVRAWRPTCPIVLGGAGFSLFPAALLTTTGADFGVVGEGERFGPLLQALSEGRAPAGLEGIAARGESVRWPAPYPGPIGRRLPTKEALALYLQRGGMMNLQTKRGCPFECFYCTYPLIEGRHVRLRPPEEVAREARALQDLGARYLFLADSLFNADHEHARAVALAFRAAGLSIPWGAFLAPLCPPPGFYADLARSGCTHVEFGTDTLSERMLAVYRKAHTKDDVLACHRAAREAGLNVAHYFLLGGPGETRETVAETLGGAERLERSVRFFFCGIRIYPRTQLCTIAREEGQLAPTQDLLPPTFYRPAAVSLDEIVALVERQAAGRRSFVIGAGGAETQAIVERLYRRGRTGPLWELLI